MNSRKCKIISFFIKMEPVAVPDRMTCLTELGLTDGHNVHNECLKSEFRSAKTIHQQIQIIKKIVPNITIDKMSKILGISTRRYYRALAGKPVFDRSTQKPPTRQLLRSSEEDEIIEAIHYAQLHNSCLNGKDIRNLASDIFKRRTTLTHEFTRDWCHDFIRRHNDKISKTKADCLDNDRASINPAEVERYIADIERIMTNPPHPLLLLNFDETGFGKRPEKGKRKSVVVYNECKNLPYWREITELHHVSLVACITAACTSLRPLLLSTRKTLDQDINGTFFNRWGSYRCTPKGYINQDSMLYWVKNHLAPYVAAVRNQIGQNQYCAIIADGCSCHMTSQVQQALNEIGNIEIIFLPPHSSHITQMLDAVVFSSMKRKFLNIDYDNSLSSRFTKKLIRIKAAYQSTVNDELIRSSWEKTGFKLNIVNGVVTGYQFDDAFKVFLRAEANHTEAA